MRTSSSLKAQSGFTLVELAIVMIIIGLLIGGVLKGQELIENAKVAAVISEVKGYTAALNTFRDTYGAIPGDMINASTRVRGCNADNACGDGDGNSIVGLFSTNTWAINQNGTTLPQIETAYFWKHLSLANLITGVDPAANPAAGAWGETHPSSAMRGGYHALYINWAVCTGVCAPNINQGSPGQSVRLQANMYGDPVTTGQGANVMSPREAWRIDSKIDDGLPQRGDVQTEGGAGCDQANYDQSNNGKNCMMYFKID